MSYHANITAALHLIHDIMPKVWAQRPEVKVWLVGKDPSADIRALADKGTASPTQKQGSVIVTGTVDDIRPYIHKSAAAVAPVPYGAGIQNKVLEAMACGAPVIASPQACSALQAQPGRDLLVAENPERFAETLLGLLGNPSQQQSLGLTARSYVERYHSWDAITGQLEQVYQSAIMRSREAKR
jgi:glycosyltransferase involved in cell wall biosynthesis